MSISRGRKVGGILAGVIGVFLLGFVVLWVVPGMIDSSNQKVSFKVVCESEEIYRIFYTMYLEGEYYSMGGMADLDGGVLTPESELELTFVEGYFDGKDISELEFEFSPYGKDDEEEIGTTNRLAIEAKYGDEYVIVFSGDEESGFKAELK